MLNKSRYALGLQLSVSLLAMQAFGAMPPTVSTADGPLKGIVGGDGSVASFKGIPFAAPPIGDLRWRAPAPPAAWKSVRTADTFSASCMQKIVPERKPWTHEFMAHNAISEDCLYLNVWTPAKSATDKLPVYVWMYGGGNVEGSTAVPIYDGANLARRGVVVVTSNYRLGVVGFLAHPELTKEAGHAGNYGSLDQVAALQWVKKNIAAFGGDPGNVTIGGQSAGASNVHNLVASPLGKGLFHRAIAESGSGIVPTNITMQMAEAEQQGLKFASAKGAKSLRELRALPADKLMPAARAEEEFSFRPLIDGYFMPGTTYEIYAQGKQNDVPELTGMNLDERSSTDDYGMIPMAEYQKVMQQRYGDRATTFFKLYPNDTQAQSGQSQKAAFRDAGLVSMHLWAQQRATTAKSKSYSYYWTHAEPGPDSTRYGAFHTSEVPYVFNTLEQSKRPWTEVDRKLAELLGNYWVNFMKSGDPNGKSLPTWPAFSANSASSMELGDASRPFVLAEKSKFEFWQQYLQRPGAVAR